MSYRVGELDQLITFNREQLTPDGIGGNTRAWVIVGEVWAHVRPVSGGEKTDFQTVNAEAKYIFIIRWPIDIKESDQIVWDGIQYNIRLISTPKSRNLYCEISAERGAGQ
jgi:SPP1 family predicted phage head-tail adaptor